MVKTMKPKLNWIIHLVKNGVACACCGEVENGFVQYACNCHTHGMAQYDHPDFQMVLNCSDQEIGRILNTLGLRVQAGERFHNGDLVEVHRINESVAVRERALTDLGVDGIELDVSELITVGECVFSYVLHT